MSRLEEKYSGVRPNTGKRLQSPATFETPQDLPRETQDPRRPQAEPDNEFEAEEEEEAGEGNKDEKVGDKEDKMTLDQFMANNTSEDNESFIDIQTGDCLLEGGDYQHFSLNFLENEKKHRLKNAWMYKDETLYLEMKANQMALPSIEQQVN